MKKKNRLSALTIAALLGTLAPSAVPAPAVAEIAPANPGAMRSEASSPQQAAQQTPATANRGPSAVTSKGWIYHNRINAVRVEVLADLGKCWRVRFHTKKLGLRGHIGSVPKSAVSFVPPHLSGGK